CGHRVGECGAATYLLDERLVDSLGGCPLVCVVVGAFGILGDHEAPEHLPRSAVFGTGRGRSLDLERVVLAQVRIDGPRSAGDCALVSTDLADGQGVNAARVWSVRIPRHAYALWRARRRIEPTPAQVAVPVVAAEIGNCGAIR